MLRGESQTASKIEPERNTHRLGQGVMRPTALKEPLFTHWIKKKKKEGGRRRAEKASMGHKTRHAIRQSVTEYSY